MLISKYHLRTRFTASTDAARPLLTTIQVRRDGEDVVAVATDGYILSEVRENVPADDEFPDNEGTDNTSQISAKSAAKIASSLKPNKMVPVLGFAQVTESGVVVTDLEHRTTIQDATVEGTYPEYESLLPKPDDAIAKVVIDPKLLATALKLFDGNNSVELLLHGDSKPVILRETTTDRTITGVVMPRRS